nr:MAG TPA: hypothetical protein [Caudoviricetes sp.]
MEMQRKPDCLYYDDSQKTIRCYNHERLFHR